MYGRRHKGLTTTNPRKEWSSMCRWKSPPGRGPIDHRPLLAGLMACGRSKDLDRGKIFHLAAIQSGRFADIRIATAVLDMYAKCGSLDDARGVFDAVVSPRDVVFWNAMIFGYVENARGSMAMELFFRFQQHGCRPSARTLVAALTACSKDYDGDDDRDETTKNKKRSIERGMALYSLALETGYGSNIFISTAVVSLFMKLGKIAEARSVFEAMDSRDTVSWNAMILGYAEQGLNEQAVESFDAMAAEGCCDPNEATVLAVIKAISAMVDREEGREVDGKIVKVIKVAEDARVSIGGNLVGNALVDLYAKCGSMVDSRRAFHRIDHPDAGSWTSLIFGHTDNGEYELAISYFESMISRGCGSNRRALVAASMACSKLAEIEAATERDGLIAKWKSLATGMAIHQQAKADRSDHQLSVATSLIDTYSKCGSMIDARRIFDRVEHCDVVLWTALIIGYAENNEAELALELFATMCDRGNCSPDSRALIAALIACSALAAANPDDRERSFILDKLGFLEEQAWKLGDVRVTNTLVDTYAKCGRFDDACRVFEKTEIRDVVSWTVIILRHALIGQGSAALEYFLRMRTESSCRADARAFAAVLVACGSSARPEIGRGFQAEIYRLGLDRDAIIPPCMIDFYGKCGDMDSAQHIFDSIGVSRQIGAWNALIMGFSRRGDGDRALAAFWKLGDEGLRPTEATLVSILTAFSRAGLVDRGKKFFEALRAAEHGVDLSLRHYTCLIDLLGRANHLEEAVGILEQMPFEADQVAWTTILGASAKWENGEVGRFALESLSALES